jgi:hypothetical protein
MDSNADAPWNSQKHFVTVNNALLRIFGGAIDYEKLHSSQQTLSNEGSEKLTNHLLEAFVAAQPQSD